MVEDDSELLVRLAEAASESLEASNLNWDLAFRLAEATAAEGAAWEARVQALTVFGMVLGAADQVLESR